MTIYIPTEAEVKAHRKQVESWPWWRQAWHRWIDTDCPFCEWYRTRMKYPPDENQGGGK
jgi:hypothetical protein